MADKDTLHYNPIYYPSGRLTIGNANYNRADTMARYKRAQGFEHFFLTGIENMLRSNKG